MQNSDEPALISKISQFYLNCTDLLNAVKTKISICLALFPYLLFVGFLSLFVAGTQKPKQKS